MLLGLPGTEAVSLISRQLVLQHHGTEAWFYNVRIESLGVARFD